MDKPKVSKVFLYSIMGGMLAFGTANTLIGKYLDNSKSPKSPNSVLPRPLSSTQCYLFTHPFL